MKVLSLWQPWASLIAIGAKRIETRGWGTDYTGPLAIAATQKIKPEAREAVEIEPAIEEAFGHPFDLGALPLGAVVAVCHLARTTVMTREAIAKVREPERAFGNYRPGRVAWVLERVRPLPKPVAVKGRQYLWDLDAKRVAEISDQLLVATDA